MSEPGPDKPHVRPGLVLFDEAAVAPGPTWTWCEVAIVAVCVALSSVPLFTVLWLYARFLEAP